LGPRLDLRDSLGTNANMQPNAQILVIDDDSEIRYSLERVLSSRGYQILTAESGEAGIELAEQASFEVIFLDNRMKGMSGMEALQHLRSVAPRAMIVLMTAFGTTQTAIEAMKFGAFDYIIKPFDIKKVIGLAERAVQAHRDLVASSQQKYQRLIDSDDYKEGIVGDSEPMQEVFKMIGQVATSDVTVMITGESGTGKELVARCIWQHSLRCDKTFMAVNCAAIPDNLIESELFGHEKGAFTGATQQRVGRFELCDRGTLFLDEIGDMALPTQTKILRALQEGEIQRVGGEKVIKVDVRLIAATNKNLEEMVEEKTFREDLYYRLNVMRIRIPSLKDRLGDVPALVDFMLQRLQKSRKSRIARVSTEAMEVLQRYTWPGNVRELENLVQRSAVVAQGDTILIKDLPKEVLLAAGGFQVSETGSSTGKEKAVEPANLSVDQDSAASISEKEETSESAAIPSPISGEVIDSISEDSQWDQLYQKIRQSLDRNLLEHMEKELIRRVIAETEGNQLKASAILGITRATLRRRLDQFDIRI